MIKPLKIRRTLERIRRDLIIVCIYLFIKMVLKRYKKLEWYREHEFITGL